MNEANIIFGMQSILLGSAIIHLLLATFLWKSVAEKLIAWYFKNIISRIRKSGGEMAIFKENARRMLHLTIFLMLSMWLILLTDSGKEAIGKYFI